MTWSVVQRDCSMMTGRAIWTGRSVECAHIMSHHCPVWCYEPKFNLSEDNASHGIDDSKNWNGAHCAIHCRNTGYSGKNEDNNVPACSNTTHITGLCTSIIHVGQVTGGPYNDAWNTSQWVPALVKSAQFVRCLPTAMMCVPISLIWYSTDS